MAGHISHDSCNSRHRSHSQGLSVCRGAKAYCVLVLRCSFWQVLCWDTEVLMSYLLKVSLHPLIPTPVFNLPPSLHLHFCTHAQTHTWKSGTGHSLCLKCLQPSTSVAGTFHQASIVVPSLFPNETNRRHTGHPVEGHWLHVLSTSSVRVLSKTLKPFVCEASALSYKKCDSRSD